MNGLEKAAKFAAKVLFLAVIIVVATADLNDWFVVAVLPIIIASWQFIRRKFILVTGILLYERITTLISRAPDVLAVILLLNGMHFVVVFFISFMINIIMYTAFIKGYYFLPDFKETLEEFNAFKKKQIVWIEYGWEGLMSWLWDKSSQWVLKNKTLMFLVGSPIFFDPDWVTFILVEGTEIKKKDLICITLPSVFVSTIFWTSVCVLGVYGFWSYDDMIARIYEHFVHMIIRT